MELDPEVDSAYPQRWLGRVAVRTIDGRVVEGEVDEPKGDPGNTLSRAELEAKALRLGAYSGAADETEMRAVIDRVWKIAGAEAVGLFLPEGAAGADGGRQPV